MRHCLTTALALSATALSAAAGAQDIGPVLPALAREIPAAAAAAPPAPALPGVGDSYTQSWDSMRPVRFDHVIEGPPGPVTLLLDGRTLDGNQTVAVYRADSNGVRIPGWRLFVITTRDGNRASGTLTLPKPARGESVGKQPVIVMVENHSRRRSQGEFALRVVR